MHMLRATGSSRPPETTTTTTTSESNNKHQEQQRQKEASYPPDGLCPLPLERRHGNCIASFSLLVTAVCFSLFYFSLSLFFFVCLIAFLRASHLVVGGVQREQRRPALSSSSLGPRLPPCRSPGNTRHTNPRRIMINCIKKETYLSFPLSLISTLRAELGPIILRLCVRDGKRVCLVKDDSKYARRSEEHEHPRRYGTYTHASPEQPKRLTDQKAGLKRRYGKREGEECIRTRAITGKQQQQQTNKQNNNINSAFSLSCTASPFDPCISPTTHLEHPGTRCRRLEHNRNEMDAHTVEINKQQTTTTKNQHANRASNPTTTTTANTLTECVNISLPFLLQF
eukprot:gene6363-4588_t